MFSKKENNYEFKKWHLLILAALIVSVIILKIYSSWWPRATVRIGDSFFSVLVADTVNHRYRGLSDRKNLGKYDGMLFVFPQKAQHTMVMRSMLFPLDIIWLDNGAIVDMAPNLAPETGRTEQELTPYFARLPSTAVLEFPAGFIAKYGLKVGDKIAIAL